MKKLQNFIKNFLQNNSITDFQKATGLGVGTIIALRDGKNEKFSKKILDACYYFFSLPKDREYYEMCSPRRTNTDVIGNILYYKRISLGLTIFRVSADTKVSEKQIARLECGKSSFSRTSTTIQPLIEYYKFSDEEKDVIYKHLELMKNLTKIVKKYQ